MDYKELVEALKSMLPPKVLYGDLIGAEGVFAHSGPYVYEDPEPYFIEQAANAITEMLARAEAAEAAQETLQLAMAEYKDRAEKAEERANRLEEEVKAYSESDLAKAHDLLSADWAKQKIRADQAEARAEKAERERDKAVKTIETILGSQKYCALCKNADCKNSITTDATCKPIWSGLEG